MDLVITGLMHGKGAYVDHVVFDTADGKQIIADSDLIYGSSKPKDNDGPETYWRVETITFSNIYSRDECGNEIPFPDYMSSDLSLVDIILDDEAALDYIVIPLTSRIVSGGSSDDTSIYYPKLTASDMMNGLSDMKKMFLEGIDKMNWTFGDMADVADETIPDDPEEYESDAAWRRRYTDSCNGFYGARDKILDMVE